MFSLPLNARIARAAGLTALAVGMVVIASLPAATQTLASRMQGESSAQEVERFCGNIVDAARDRRYALQAMELEKLQKDVNERIKLLEEKRAEFETWLARRDKFMKQAQETVVDIYAKMRPDAAAGQLSELGANTAAAILMSLDARKASVILNEMEQKTAAGLAGIMVMAARQKDPS